MKYPLNILTLVLLSFSMTAFGQNFKGRLVMGRAYAEQEVKNAIAGKTIAPFYDTLIRDKRSAISTAEPILFKRYGKAEVIKQRPYESYLIDGYWFISGTLKKGWDGGTFQIILDSRNGQMIQLMYGK